MQEGLDRTKKLGSTGDDVDDVLTWVSKSRQTEQARQAEAAQRRRAAAQKAAARNSDSEDEEDEDLPTAVELAGAKVKHTADELAEGETMILTLGEPSMMGGGVRVRAGAASTEHLCICGALLCRVQGAGCEVAPRAPQPPSAGILSVDVPGWLPGGIKTPALPACRGPRYSG